MYSHRFAAHPQHRQPMMPAQHHNMQHHNMQQQQQHQAKRFSASAEIDRIVLANKVVIFSKTVCPYCFRVKDLLNSMNVPFHVEELDKRPHGTDIHMRLYHLTGQETVPNVVVDGVSIGGFDAVQKLAQEGKLIPLLKKVGALPE